MREEGIRGFYKGLSASYLGVTETTIQWVLYERLKKLCGVVDGQNGVSQWIGMMASAGSAKLVATTITYPHEVCPFESFLSESTFKDFDINRCFGLDFDNHWLTELSDTRVYCKHCS